VATIEEQKQSARFHLLTEFLLNDSNQAGKTLSHVSRLDVGVHTRRREETQHEGRPPAWALSTAHSTRRIDASSQPGGIWTRIAGDSVAGSVISTVISPPPRWSATICTGTSDDGLVSPPGRFNR
jgi:hypothetical protein